MGLSVLIVVLTRIAIPFTKVEESLFFMLLILVP